MQLPSIAGVLFAAVAAAGNCLAQSPGQTVTLSRSSHGRVRQAIETAPSPATSVMTVDLHVRLQKADPATRGELWLEVAAESSGSPSARVILRIPLSSTGDVYGESRSCTAAPGGASRLIFTAGMDEQNFARFATSTEPQEMHLLLNKYLCRALAAPFHCNGKEVELPTDWTHWKIATAASFTLSSSAPARITASALKISGTGRTFDPTTCATIAPSTGMCCVAGKSTQWHCGSMPVGDAWHQVSGECFHRETGGICGQQDHLPRSRVAAASAEWSWKIRVPTLTRWCAAHACAAHAA